MHQILHDRGGDDDASVTSVGSELTEDSVGGRRAGKGTKGAVGTVGGGQAKDIRYSLGAKGTKGTKRAPDAGAGVSTGVGAGAAGVGTGAGGGVRFSPRAPVTIEYDSPRRAQVGAVRVSSPGGSSPSRIHMHSMHSIPVPLPLPALPTLPADLPIRGQAQRRRDDDSNASTSPTSPFKKNKPFKKLRPIPMSMPYQPVAGVEYIHAA
jgi:hypothetical protein